MKSIFTRAALMNLFAFLCFSFGVEAQTKVYRGSIGNSHIQMRLNFNGNEVSGTYAYDSVGDELRLTGRTDSQGGLQLSEFAGKGKQQTGKFVCKRGLEDPVNSDCTWSKPDGTRDSMVTLEEQHFAFTNGLQVVPKTISNRRTGVGVSYPQISRNGPLSAGAQSFNRRILALVQKAISDFAPIDGRGVFDTNYNVLLGANELISVEMTEYYDGGGAHPNNRFWSLTFDLASDKELKFDDLFKLNSDYVAAIAKFVTADIDRRAAELEKEDAQRENRPPKPREEPLVAVEELSEISGWAMTPKGVTVYFDFPHVMAFFDKTFVPYSAVRQYLNPSGPAGRFQ